MNKNKKLLSTALVIGSALFSTLIASPEKSNAAMGGGKKPPSKNGKMTTTTGSNIKSPLTNPLTDNISGKNQKTLSNPNGQTLPSQQGLGSPSQLDFGSEPKNPVLQNVNYAELGAKPKTRPTSQKQSAITDANNGPEQPIRAQTKSDLEFKGSSSNLTELIFVDTEEGSGNVAAYESFPPLKNPNEDGDGNITPHFSLSGLNADGGLPPYDSLFKTDRNDDDPPSYDSIGSVLRSAIDINGDDDLPPDFKPEPPKQKQLTISDDDLNKLPDPPIDDPEDEIPTTTASFMDPRKYRKVVIGGYSFLSPINRNLDKVKHPGKYGNKKRRIVTPLPKSPLTQDTTNRTNQEEPNTKRSKKYIVSSSGSRLWDRLKDSTSSSSSDSDSEDDNKKIKSSFNSLEYKKPIKVIENDPTSKSSIIKSKGPRSYKSSRRVDRIRANDKAKVNLPKHTPDEGYKPTNKHLDRVINPHKYRKDKGGDSIARRFRHLFKKLYGTPESPLTQDTTYLTETIITPDNIKTDSTEYDNKLNEKLAALTLKDDSLNPVPGFANTYLRFDHDNNGGNKKLAKRGNSLNYSNGSGAIFPTPDNDNEVDQNALNAGILLRVTANDFDEEINNRNPLNILTTTSDPEEQGNRAAIILGAIGNNVNDDPNTTAPITVTTSRRNENTEDDNNAQTAILLGMIGNNLNNSTEKNRNTELD